MNRGAITEPQRTRRQKFFLLFDPAGLACPAVSFPVGLSEQATGGAQRRLLTAAACRPWRGSQGSAAPGLPGRGLAYLKKMIASTLQDALFKRDSIKR